MSSKQLDGFVCIVTGATRGIGKGIAIQLGRRGATVYITGRTLEPVKDAPVGGSLRETAEEITSHGGVCIPVVCDHNIDDQICELFKKVEDENCGRLDVLVNCAYSAVGFVNQNMGKAFWELPMTSWDTFNAVGLRDYFICAQYAAKLMVPKRKGLIVNISSAKAAEDYFLCAGFGIGKCACDRMVVDCGLELKPHSVAFVSVWPAPVPTEQVIAFLRHAVQSNRKVEMTGIGSLENFMDFFEKEGESAEFVGQCVAAMATDASIMEKSGTKQKTCDLGKEYEIVREPVNLRAHLV